MPIAGKKHNATILVSISPHDDIHIVVNKDILIGKIAEWREGNTKEVDLYICYYFNGKKFIRINDDYDTKTSAIRAIKRERSKFLNLKTQ